ncbi:MAG: hypothetical protein AB1330_12155 [Bacillota bacterium]
MMDYKILVGLLLLTGLVYYFRQAHTSQRNKKRIVDLLSIGALLWVTPKLSAYTKMDPFEIGGMLIFAYGWGILIVEKFWEGLKGNDHDNTPHSRPKRVREKG